jgi:hypothetical protein
MDQPARNAGNAGFSTDMANYVANRTARPVNACVRNEKSLTTQAWVLRLTSGQISNGTAQQARVWSNPFPMGNRYGAW